jgi:PTS system nitrogen regulatory IIA component
MMSRICDILDRRHVIPGLGASDKTSLVRELAQRAAVALKLDESVITTALTAREQLGSTGVGGGVAIPHARIDGIENAFGMFARIEPAVDFAAIDGRPIDLAFLLLTPMKAAAGHLSLLAAISRRLRDRAAVAAIRGAGNAREIYDILTSEAEAR